MRESVKPMEKIEGIRILHVDGLAGVNGQRRRRAARSPTDEVIESALRYRVQAPMIDQVLKEIGIEGGNLARMGGLMREASDMQRVAKEAAAPPKPDGAAPKGPEARRTGRAVRPRRPEARWLASTSPASSGRPRPGSGRACATSTGCRTGTRPSRESRIENGEPSDKVGCIRAFSLRNGDRLREQLLGLSDYDMFCTYSILTRRCR